ncbi:hypothetical protein SBOR_8631 [Sclerotinia borealis F-4128]|uniref:Uncharacterized protein n=1 Tax=Sclerotinia borealis (strain F-4128) TaxID=1432307 RepID=W9C2I3_SCLBF|nr:hypothetical protein SBOR_8631 [Sclerotinia borealis F-4128]
MRATKLQSADGRNHGNCEKKALPRRHLQQLQLHTEFLVQSWMPALIQPSPRIPKPRSTRKPKPTSSAAPSISSLELRSRTPSSHSQTETQKYLLILYQKPSPKTPKSSSTRKRKSTSSAIPPTPSSGIENPFLTGGTLSLEEQLDHSRRESEKMMDEGLN